MTKISAVLATREEKENIGGCLDSVKGLADEIVVVDEGSKDKTREIAKSYGAKVYKTKHEPIFHKTKQKALERATGDWVLQLDADERVTPELASEIKQVVEMSKEELEKREIDSTKRKLFLRHQRLVEERDGRIGKRGGEVVAFFVPRRNFFLGKAMTYGGTYPDGVIRLVKKGKARFPGKSVHEQIEVDGGVGWLENDLVHLANPTLAKYLSGAGKYTDLLADDLRKKGAKFNPVLALFYLLVKPLLVFLALFIRHKSFLDGIHGFLWSVFSAFHFPVAYLKLWLKY